MESNGKSVLLDGRPAECGTAAIIWGEPANNGQHSFFQLLHQGTRRAALDFLLPAQSSCADQAHQDLAIASCLAQAEALMTGQPAEVVRQDLGKQGLAADRIAALVPHKVHEGSRPSSIVSFERLDPSTLGKLIALYEHCVFTQSVIWGINAFDQWGVELGKKLCETLVPLVRDPALAAAASPSVKGLLERIAAWRGA